MLRFDRKKKPATINICKLPNEDEHRFKLQPNLTLMPLKPGVQATRIDTRGSIIAPEPWENITIIL